MEIKGLLAAELFCVSSWCEIHILIEYFQCILVLCRNAASITAYPNF